MEGVEEDIELYREADDIVEEGGVETVSTTASTTVITADKLPRLREIHELVKAGKHWQEHCHELQQLEDTGHPSVYQCHHQRLYPRPCSSCEAEQRQAAYEEGANKALDRIREIMFIKDATADELVRRLELWADALCFYADPDTYFAIGFFPDNPAGEFMDDFSECNECKHLYHDETSMKPGKRAREAIGIEEPELSEKKDV